MQIATERLLLRPFTLDDAPAVQRLVSAYEIAENTLLIPHPYPEGAAAEWISKLGAHEHNHVFAITLEGDVIGAIGIEIQREHDRGEIGYWMGVPYWGRGYMTEAVRGILGWAFESLGLHRVFALHFTRNPASGRVMQKAGMRHEGSLRGHDKKWGEHLDCELFGILDSDFR